MGVPGKKSLKIRIEDKMIKYRRSGKESKDGMIWGGKRKIKWKKRR